MNNQLKHCNPNLISKERKGLETSLQPPHLTKNHPLLKVKTALYTKIWQLYIYMRSVRKKKMEAPIRLTLPPFTYNSKVFGLRGIFILLNFYLYK
jgi:hypothetical protein